jgi:ribulose kinase
MYRAILESVAYGTRNILEHFKNMHVDIHRIVACGGVLNNSLWLQIIADVTGMPIQKVGFGEAGVLGCAICSAVGLGLYTDLAQAANNMVHFGEIIYPQKQNYEIYTHYFEHYKKTYNLLEPQMYQFMQKQR